MLDIAIVLNGDLQNLNGFKYLLDQASYIIAVDGGFNHLRKLNIKPDLFLGDQDSADLESLNKAKEWLTKTKIFPTKKNFTDSELALQIVFSESVFKINYINKPKIALLAAFGKRYDHLLSNQFLAEEYSHKADFILSDGLNLQYILRGPQHLKLKWPLHESEEKQKFTFSLLAMSNQVTSLTLKHAMYPLRNFHLKHGKSIGVSNIVDCTNESILGTKDVEVSFEKGCLSIMVVPSI